MGEPDDDSPKAPPESFLRRLCSCLCGGPDDGTQRPLRPTPPRTIYVPPAPHTGNPFIPALQERDLGKKARTLGGCRAPAPGVVCRAAPLVSPSDARAARVPPAPHTASPDSRSCCAPRAQTLVLDLDETLVHSSFRPVPNPDYVIPVEIDGKVCPRASACTRLPARPPGGRCAGTPPRELGWAVGQGAVTPSPLAPLTRPLLPALGPSDHGCLRAEAPVGGPLPGACRSRGNRARPRGSDVRS